MDTCIHRNTGLCKYCNWCEHSMCKSFCRQCNACVHGGHKNRCRTCKYGIPKKARKPICAYEKKKPVVTHPEHYCSICSYGDHRVCCDDCRRYCIMCACILRASDAAICVRCYRCNHGLRAYCIQCRHLPQVVPAIVVG